MVDREDSFSCATCGAECALEGVCVSCDAVEAPAIRVLPPLPGGDPFDPPPVHLVRELKLPAMHRLLSDPGRAAERLPEQMSSMEEALQSGDLDTADQLIDAALGMVLAGPGHEKRAVRWGRTRTLGWICLALCVLVCFFAWLWG